MLFRELLLIKLSVLTALISVPFLSCLTIKSRRSSVSTVTIFNRSAIAITVASMTIHYCHEFLAPISLLTFVLDPSPPKIDLLMDLPECLQPSHFLLCQLLLLAAS